MRKGRPRPVYTSATVKRAQALHAAGLTLRQVQAQLQRERRESPSVEWIRRQVKSRSVSEAHRLRSLGHRPEEVHREARLMARAGLSCEEIREALGGITKPRLRSILGAAIPTRSASLRRYHDKVKPDRPRQRREAAMLRELGWTYERIGNRFGVSISTAREWTIREREESAARQPDIPECE